MATEQQLLAALRAADAAGNHDDATRIAGMIQAQRQQAPTQPKPRSGWQQFGDSIVNNVAGAAQGIASIPDAVTEAIGGAARYVAKPGAFAAETLFNGIGRPDLSKRVEQNHRTFDAAMGKPATFSRMIENAAPTPQDSAGQWARFGSQMLGGAMVPFGPKTAGAAPTRLPPRPNPPRVAPGTNMEVVNAGTRRNVPVRAPDAIPTLRGQMAKVEASPYGGPKVASALDADKALMQTRVAEVGGAGVPHPSNYSFGSQIQNAGQRFIKSSGTTKNALYSRAEHRAGGARVVPSDTIAAVDAHIAELEGAGANSNSSVINYLKGLRDDLSKPGGFSITEFQGLRAANRAKIRGDQALTVSDADRRLGDVLKTFTDDAGNQLPVEAVDALRTADKYYAQRHDYINGVLKKFMGGRNSPLAPERAAGRLTNMGMSKAGVDYTTLSRFMARAEIAATFAENLGKGANGEFGLGPLATNIEKMPANVRQLVFGKDGAAALEDLRILARAKSDTSKGLNNSRSGVVMARQIGTRIASSATAGGVLGGWAGAVISPAITETAALVGQRRAANLLLNPQFTKAVRSVGTNPNPAAAKVLMTRLAVVASRNPAIADEIGAFVQAMNTNVPRQLSAGQSPEYQQGQQDIPQP
jgi:hypothetical protein